jgi:hypothetical protein
MPYVNKPRPYKHEYETYDGTEAVKKKRAQRNKARRMLERMRPRRQLGEEEHDNEKKMTQRQHRFSLTAKHYIRMARPLSPPEAASL